MGSEKGEILGTEAGGTVDTEVVDELEAEEEVEPQETLSTPSMPSHDEVELHRALGHINFRAWCDQCVEGRGKEMGHVSTEGRARAIPIIGFDYCFVSKAGVFSRED